MELQQLHFANPEFLWGFALIPLVFVLFYYASRARRSTLFLGNARLVEAAQGTFSAQAFPWFLRLMIISLCLIAAARPQSGQKKVEEKKPVTDLFVAFDVSGSMITADLKPSRVIAAKKFLSQFLDKVENVRVGIEIFAAIPFTQCPMTTDIPVVKQLLSNVDITSKDERIDGTAIGDALVACLGRLQKGTGQNGALPAKSSSFFSKMIDDNAVPQSNDHQAIILLTDGGDNASQIPPLTAAKLAARQGVKIYTIGVGSLESVPMIITDESGQTRYVQDPRTGGVAMSDPVDMTLLKEIARLTGGKSYSAQDNHSLQMVLDDIAHLEKRDVVTVTDWEYQELGSYFLMIAFLFLALDMALEMTVLRTLP